MVGFETDGIESKMRLHPPSHWESDNDWDIPLLDISRCALILPLPLTPWSSQNQSKKMPGTWHFYVDDYKIEGLWPQGCDKIFKSSPLALIEPNFSIPWDAPRAIALYQIYRKRWIARTLQSAGLFCVVDLNVDFRHLDLALLGVPEGWRAYATRGSAWDTEVLLKQWAAAKTRSGIDHPLFVVYSGGQKVEAICKDNGWQYYPTYRGAMTYRNAPAIQAQNIFLEESLGG